jgi:hypothetical protein
MPKLRRHFSTSYQRSDLSLSEPRGSRRQIIYFIGLFWHLEDLKLLYDTVNHWEEPVDNLTLTPLAGGKVREGQFTPLDSVERIL